MDRRVPPRRTGRRRSERGLVLVEVLAAIIIAAIGLLAHAAGILRVHSLNRAEETRAHALQTVRATVEMMRDDADWPGLYARLSYLRGRDGGWHPVTSYYPDLEVPEELQTCRLQIDVPRYPSASGTSGLVLREDRTEARFGLPFDLNGDGVVTANDMNSTYLILPVVLVLRWREGTEIEQELRLPTWLRGERR